jgi:hypothetical protein
MGMACSTRRGEEECINNFEKAKQKKATRKT